MLQKFTRAGVKNVFLKMSAIDLNNPPAWVTCPRCAKTWSKLAPEGVCIECSEGHEAGLRQSPEYLATRSD